VVAVGGQTNRPVDDVGLVTDEGGWVTIQAKKGMRVDRRAGGGLGEALGQLVEIDEVGVPDGATDALRPLEPDRDLVLILSDDSAAGTVNANLAPVVNRLRELPADVPVADAAPSESQRGALDILKYQLGECWKDHWKDRSAGEITEAEFPVITTDRTAMTGATQLARILTIPVPRRPSGMCFFGWVLILLGAVPAVLIGIASQGQEAHSVSMWSSLSAGLVPGIVVWLPGIFFAIAGYSRLRAYDREGPIRDMTRRVWSSAGYCARDDVVFLPDGSRAAPARALSMMYNSACQILTAQSDRPRRT
jgi:hypothetical protein